MQKMAQHIISLVFKMETNSDAKVIVAEQPADTPIEEKKFTSRWEDAAYILEKQNVTAIESHRNTLLALIQNMPEGEHRDITQRRFNYLDSVSRAYATLDSAAEGSSNPNIPTEPKASKFSLKYFDIRGESMLSEIDIGTKYYLCTVVQGSTDGLGEKTNEEIDQMLRNIDWVSFSWKSVPREMFMTLFSYVSMERVAFLCGYFRAHLEAFPVSDEDDMIESLWDYFKSQK